MARSFNGTTNKCDITATYFAGNYTISAWTNPSGNSAAAANIWASGSSGTFGTQFRQETTAWVFYHNNVGGFSSASSGAVLVANTWQNLVASWDGSNIRIYFNGVLKATTAKSGVVNSGTINSIGYDNPDGVIQFFPGSIADFGIWNTVLTAGEIAALANGARPSTIRPTSLAAWWPLDGLQSPEPDLSGNAANGTLTGTALAAGPPIMQFTPRWPLNSRFGAAAAGAAFQPAWALNRNRIFDGVAT